jgi:PAS domain S-box-containing protein
MRHSVHDSIHVTAGEIARNFGQWQDRALTQPVVVTHHGRPRVVMVSADEYAADLDQGDARSRSGEPGDLGLATLLENMTGAFVALDSDMQIAAVNHAFELLSDLPASDLVGRTLEDALPNNRPLFAEHLRRTLRTGEVGELQIEGPKYPGRTYIVRTFSYLGGVAALIRNNTAERELQAATHRDDALRTALAMLPGIGIVSLNIRGVFTQVDDGFTRQTGFSIKDLNTARLSDIVRPADRHAVTEALEKSLQGGEPTTFTTTLLIKQLSEKPFHVSLAPVVGDGMPEGLAAVFTNAAEPAHTVD